MYFFFWIKKFHSNIILPFSVVHCLYLKFTFKTPYSGKKGYLKSLIVSAHFIPFGWVTRAVSNFLLSIALEISNGEYWHWPQSTRGLQSFLLLTPHLTMCLQPNNRFLDPTSASKSDVGGSSALGRSHPWDAWYDRALKVTVLLTDTQCLHCPQKPEHWLGLAVLEIICILSINFLLQYSTITFKTKPDRLIIRFLIYQTCWLALVFPLWI